MVLLLVGEAKLHFLTLCLLLYTSNNFMVICKPLQQNSNDRRRSTDQYLMTIDSKLIIDQNLAKLMNFRRMLNEKLLIKGDRDLINIDFDDNDDDQQRNFDQKRSISKNHNQHHHQHHNRNRRINRKKSSTFNNDLLNELLMADSSGVSEKSPSPSSLTSGRTFRINANLNSSPSQSSNRNNQRMMDRSSSSSSGKNIVRRNDAPFAVSASDGYSAECPRSRDKPHQIMCPSRRKHGYHVCIDETALCNGVPDCPQGEDENPAHCMFYKTSMRYFKTVVDQVVQLSDTVLRIQSRQNDEL